MSLPRTDVVILKIFSPKKIAKKLAFLTHNKARLGKFLIITLVFEKKRQFFAENWQKFNIDLIDLILKFDLILKPIF
jgi:hypothetical protein